MNAVDEGGYTPLHKAAQRGAAAAAEWLIEHSANVNTQANDGSTALVKAAIYGTAGVTDVLLQKDSLDLTVIYDTRTAREWAIQQGHSKIVGRIDEKIRQRDEQRRLTEAKKEAEKKAKNEAEEKAKNEAEEKAKKEAEEKAKKEAEEKAKKETRKVARIQLHGQASGDHQHNMMGVYELQDVSTHWVNGRGVWKHEGKEHYLYYASNGEWFASDKEDMLAGTNNGWVSTAADTALTPDKISAEWTVWTGGEGWEAAPKVRSTCKE